MLYVVWAGLSSLNLGGVHEKGHHKYRSRILNTDPHNPGVIPMDLQRSLSIPPF